MEINQIIKLSPRSLSLFLECPRCFWLEKVKGKSRPKKPSSSLPNGMDQLIKKYFDKYRARGKFPPEIEGVVEGKIFVDQERIRKWRSWQKTELKYEDKNLRALLSGALDECFMLNGFYIPVDYKTRGFEPENYEEYSQKYYQFQLDCYTFLLEISGYPHLNFGYLIYYVPMEIREGGVGKFKIEAVKLETHPERIKEIFEKAVKTLRGPIPKPDPNCKFCAWAQYWSQFKIS